MTYANDKLYVGAAEIDAVKKDRLYRFAESLLNRRGDFMMSGKYGVDFKINYKGKPVTYENRNFYLDGKLLKALQLSELNGLQNKSSQYTLMFIVVHVAIDCLISYLDSFYFRKLFCRELSWNSTWYNLLALFRHIVDLFIRIFNFYSLNLHKQNKNYGRSTHPASGRLNSMGR